MAFANSFDVNYVFITQKETLLPGDSVYCFTDGAVELNNTGQSSDFNERKFAKVLSQVPLVDWKEAILKALTSVAGKSTFDDDITILRFHMK